MDDPKLGSPPAPSPVFVARNERERLVELFSELVMDRGFENVTLEHLAAEGGVSIETVHDYFESTEQCALVASEVGTEQMFAAAGAAFLSTPGDCPLAARAALDAMLRFFASMPAMVHVAVIEHERIGPNAIAARHKAMAMFAEFLGPGFAAAGEDVPEPEVLSTLIAGGIYHLVARFTIEGRLHELPEMLPAVTYFTVGPFFGLDEAHRVSSLPPPSSPTAR